MREAREACAGRMREPGDSGYPGTVTEPSISSAPSSPTALTEPRSLSSARSLVVAFDGFKGSITAADACRAFAAGWHRVHPDTRIVQRPMADGGEGTLEAIATAYPASVQVPVRVTGPDDRPHTARWLRIPTLGTSAGTDAGFVELAATSGIELLQKEPHTPGHRPWDAHTVGFGEAIRDALSSGVTRLILSVGSSASVDGGTGLLTALGVRFTDAHGRVVAPGARAMADIAAVDWCDALPLPPGGVVVLCDVDNPLLGPSGAAQVFAPQKGFTSDELPALESALAHLAHLYGIDPAISGTGAAGGAALALHAWGAELVPGAEYVGELLAIRDTIQQLALDGPCLVITGEGSFDTQSAHGKAPSFVIRAAQDAGADLAIVAGRIDPEFASGSGSLSRATAVSLTELAGSANDAMTHPERWLQQAGARLASVVMITPPFPHLGSLQATHAAFVGERPGGAEEDVHMVASVVDHVIERYSVPGDTVFDPFAGFGTTLARAVALGRQVVGVELLPERVDHIHRTVPGAEVVEGDARGLLHVLQENGLEQVIGTVDLILTSPPYMTANDHDADPLTAYERGGANYARYLRELSLVAVQCSRILRAGGVMVWNVGNIHYGGALTNLIEDCSRVLADHLTPVGLIEIEWDTYLHDIVRDALIVVRA